MASWRKWVHQPQRVWVRRALFQVHLWSGLATGVYVVVLCLSGSVLVYRNELYSAFSPKPVFVSGAGEPISVDELKAAARRMFPSYDVAEVDKGKTVNQAADVTLRRGAETRRRLLNPYTGEDLGDPLPAGFRFTAWLLDLHDNLLYGETGRRVNGIGAIILIALCATGAVIWWPGIASWRRSLSIEAHANWKRLTWTLHSALGFWFFAFMLMWGITAAYLCFPDTFSAVFDAIQPMDPSSFDERLVDRIQYWLAYAHFGRLGGRGIPGCGRGLCDSATKMIWAIAGLVPPAMFVTGAVMWWNRVVRPRARQSGANRLRSPDTEILPEAAASDRPTAALLRR